MSHHSLTNCFQIYWCHGQQEEENACRCRSGAMSTGISLQQERQAEQWCWLGRRVAELKNPNVEALPELMAFLGALEWWRIRMCYLYSLRQNVICDFRRTRDEATWEPQNKGRQKDGWTCLRSHSYSQVKLKSQCPCFSLWFLFTGCTSAPWCLFPCVLCPNSENGRSSL